MKRRGSSETRFPKVWCRSELCSRGKRPFEVSKIFCPGTVTRWHVFLSGGMFWGRRRLVEHNMPPGGMFALGWGHVHATLSNSMESPLVPFVCSFE